MRWTEEEWEAVEATCALAWPDSAAQWGSISRGAPALLCVKEEWSRRYVNLTGILQYEGDLSVGIRDDEIWVMQEERINWVSVPQAALRPATEGEIAAFLMRNEKIPFEERD